MKILAIGDVVGKIGCEFLREKLPTLKKEKQIDLVIANGENSAEGNGILPSSADFLFKSGVDIITTGNHTFKRKESLKLFEETQSDLIRPANFPNSNTPGKGYCVFDFLTAKVIIINLLGIIYLENMDCPFKTIDKILEEIKKQNAITILDFHAEATSEKKAMGYYLDGKISAMFGTHTHVQTADEMILPNGMGYITDVGMTGVIHSALGIEPNIIIKKLTTKMPVKFYYAKGKCNMNCIIFEVDEKTKKTINIERLNII